MATGVIKLELGRTARDSRVFLNDIDISRYVVRCQMDTSVGQATMVVLELVPERIDLPEEIEAAIQIYREE